MNANKFKIEGITFTGSIPEESIDELNKLMQDSIPTQKNWSLKFEGEITKQTKEMILEMSTIKELFKAIYCKQCKWLTNRLRLTSRLQDKP